MDQQSDRVGQILQPNREGGRSRSRSRIKDRIVVGLHPLYSLIGLIGMLSIVMS